MADSDVARAEATLDRSRTVDIAARGAAYRQTGWTGFDETAPAYTADQVEREHGSNATIARY